MKTCFAKHSTVWYTELLVLSLTLILGLNANV